MAFFIPYHVAVCSDEKSAIQEVEYYNIQGAQTLMIDNPNKWDFTDLITNRKFAVYQANSGADTRHLNEMLGTILPTMVRKPVCEQLGLEAYGQDIATTPRSSWEIS